jgi:hypothetical protein
MTMTLIETKTLGTAAASIEFTSIPQTFTDLFLLYSARTTRASVAESVGLNVNGTTSVSIRGLYGTGSSAASFSDGRSVGFFPSNNATANTFSNSSLYFPNYTGSTQKSVSADSVSENNATEAYQNLHALLYTDTIAITSFGVQCLEGGTLAIGSTFSLYGILKGSDGIVTTS